MPSSAGGLDLPQGQALVEACFIDRGADESVVAVTADLGEAARDSRPCRGQPESFGVKGQ